MTSGHGARLVALLWLLANTAAARPPTEAAVRPYTHRPRTVDVEHLRLELTLDLVKGSVKGTSTLTVTPLRNAKAVVLDAVAMTIEGVRVGPAGEPAQRHAVETTYTGKTLRVPLEEPAGGPLDVEISYSATPAAGLYFVKADPAYPGIGPEAWSQGEPEESRFWFPGHDYPNDRFTSELVVTVPRELAAVSNGSLVSDEPVDGGLHRVHYRMEQRHAGYLVSLVVAPLERVALEGHPRVPVAVWAPPGRADDARATFGVTPRIVSYFEELTGIPYPYARYDQVLVHDFMWSGMENTTTTTLTVDALHGPILREESDADGLIAHELAHQWFGDLVTCSGWRHLWLNEGFASYMETLWLEHERGQAAGDLDRLGGADWYFGSTNPRALNEPRFEHPDDLFDAQTYAKGAAVLHMLRRTLGETAFVAGLRHYLAANRDGLVEENDLRRALETSSGRDLTEFFAEWVERPGHPKLRASWRWDNSQREVEITVDPGRTPWHFDLPVTLDTADGPQQVLVPVGDVRTVKRFAATRPPRFVVFDPRRDWLMELTEEPSVGELLARLEGSTEPVTRVRTAEALADRELSTPQRADAVAALLRLADSDNEPEKVRTTALSTLGTLGGAAAMKGLMALTKSPAPKVRAAAVGAVGDALAHPSTADALEMPHKGVVAEVFRGLAIHDPSPAVRVQAYDSAERLLPKSARLALCREALSAAPTEGSESVALQGLTCLDNEGSVEALDLALGATRWGQAHALRERAVGVVARIAQNHRKKKDLVRLALEALLGDPKRGVVIAAIEGLGTLGDPHSGPALRALTPLAEQSRDVSQALKRALEAVREPRPAAATPAPGLDERVRALEERVDELERER